MSTPVFGMTQYDFQRVLQEIQRAILPVGSLEQHGNHLPVSTDSLIAEYVARMVGEKLGAFVLPVMCYGVSFEHKPMFNVSLHSSTLTTLVCDACTSLADNGITQIIIINGHHGNIGALQYISQELVNNDKSKTINVNTIHYWQMLKKEFDHAGEVETSLMLAIAPELVRMDKAVPNTRSLTKSKAAYNSITNSPGSFPKITGNGVWGDPRKATAEKGRKWIEDITSMIAKTIEELESN
jgi:creatinine amidohydrolase